MDLADWAYGLSIDDFQMQVANRAGGSEKAFNLKSTIENQKLPGSNTPVFFF
jgi:hypothetical protein